MKDMITAETLARLDELEMLKKDIAHNITEYKAGGTRRSLPSIWITRGDATQIAINKIDERIKELKNEV